MNVICSHCGMEMHMESIVAFQHERKGTAAGRDAEGHHIDIDAEHHWCDGIFREPTEDEMRERRLRAKYERGKPYEETFGLMSGGLARRYRKDLPWGAGLSMIENMAWHALKKRIEKARQSSV